jgi:hypothetical protein
MNKLLNRYNNLLDNNNNYNIYIGKKLFDSCFYTNINKRSFELCFKIIKNINDYNNIKYKVYTKYILDDKELIVLRDGSNYCLQITNDINNIYNDNIFIDMKKKNRIKNDKFPSKYEYDNTILYEIISFEYDSYNINFSINYDEKFINEIYIEIKNKDFVYQDISHIINKFNKIIKKH